MFYAFSIESLTFHVKRERNAQNRPNISPESKVISNDSEIPGLAYIVSFAYASSVDVAGVNDNVN